MKPVHFNVLFVPQLVPIYHRENTNSDMWWTVSKKFSKQSNCCFIWPGPAPMKFMYPYPFKKMSKMRTIAAATQVKGYSVYLRRLSFQKRGPQYPTLVRQMMKAKLNSCYLGSQYRILCVPTPFALQVSPLANKYLY